MRARAVLALLVVCPLMSVVAIGYIEESASVSSLAIKEGVRLPSRAQESEGVVVEEPDFMDKFNVVFRKWERARLANQYVNAVIEHLSGVAEQQGLSVEDLKSPIGTLLRAHAALGVFTNGGRDLLVGRGYDPLRIAKDLTDLGLIHAAEIFSDLPVMSDDEAEVAVDEIEEIMSSEYPEKVEQFIARSNLGVGMDSR